MLCVPAGNRSFAVGLLTFGIHAMGDVPSPVIVGYLKDSLAPACNIDGNGEFEDLDACRKDSGGIQVRARKERSDEEEGNTPTTHSPLTPNTTFHVSLFS